MPIDNPRPGAGSVAEFQVSPIPWMTSSVLAASSSVRFDMPYLASSLMLLNASTGSTDVLAFGFTSTGAAGTRRHRILPNTRLGPLDLRFKTLWLAAPSGSVSFDVLVGLTGISARDCGDFSDATGSAYFAGVS